MYYYYYIYLYSLSLSSARSSPYSSIAYIIVKSQPPFPQPRYQPARRNRDYINIYFLTPRPSPESKLYVIIIRISYILYPCISIICIYLPIRITLWWASFSVSPRTDRRRRQEQNKKGLIYTTGVLFFYRHCLVFTDAYYLQCES